jgi:hypothetical protein
MNEELEPSWETIFEELREEVLELEESDSFKEEESEPIADFDVEESEDENNEQTD